MQLIMHLTTARDRLPAEEIEESNVPPDVHSAVARCPCLPPEESGWNYPSSQSEAAGHQVVQSLAATPLPFGRDDDRLHEGREEGGVGERGCRHVRRQLMKAIQQAGWFVRDTRSGKRAATTGVSRSEERS